MEYVELRFTHSSDQQKNEILIAVLSEIGFESFVNHNDGLSAYIAANQFNEDHLSILKEYPLLQSNIEFKINKIEQQNWNAKWESDYQAVLIPEKCCIRAPFHEPPDSNLLDIIIEPKMSFGTAHHETTRLMIEMLYQYPPVNKQVLDMGCGTGILAMLAYKLGAREIVAVDNDEWAFENANDNITQNNVDNISVYHGDATLIKNFEFDVIIANINRNILLRDLENYNSVLRKDGVIFLSGFYINDIPDLRNKAESFGLKLYRQMDENNWVSILLKKQI